jgi:glycosyltransferase involved in cell wall biosynthesis
MGLLRKVTSDDVEWMIIDNGSTEPIEEFFIKYLKPKRFNYIRNNENVGLVKTYQQIYENCETEALGIVHNDVFIYEPGWDKVITGILEQNDSVGMIGLFGAQGCGPYGERIQDVPNVNTAPGWSNMLEAEIHGQRIKDESKPAAVFDGFAMFMRKKILDESGGIDQRYQFHHIYDRELSLVSLAQGYKNIVIDIPCHHMSGITANRPEYQEWVDKQTAKDRGAIRGDKYTHDHNSQLFYEKWKDYLPVYVEDDFSFREGVQGQWEYKGDAITKFDTKE